MSVYYSTKFIAICFSLLTCISARAMTSSPPPPTSSHHAFGATQEDAHDMRFDLKANDTVNAHNEERMGIFDATTSASIKQSAEKLLTRDKSMVTFDNQETAENLLTGDNSFKRTVADDNQEATSQSRLKSDMEIDGSENTKVLESIEEHMENLSLDKEAQSSKKRKGNEDIGSSKKAKLLESIQGLDEDKILHMIAEAKKHEDTRLEAKFLQTCLLEQWKKDGKTFKDIFSKPSDDEFAEILKHPLPEIWFLYAVQTGQYPYEMLLHESTLRYGEVGLARRLVVEHQADKDGTGLKSVATQLFNVQIRKWDQSGQTLRDVFRRLKLGRQNLRSLVKDPALDMWFSYAIWLGKDPYDLFLSAMRKHVDDVGLAQLLAVAEQDGGYLAIVEELKICLFSEWDIEEKSEHDVFRQLGLEEGGIESVGSPLWNIWLSYAEYLEHEDINSEDSLLNMVSNTGNL